METTEQLNELVTQDTSSNALTEVALGLSMAFFALLILALVSVALPKKIDKISESTPVHSIKTEITSNKENTKTTSDTIFVFYYKGKMVDKEMSVISYNNIPVGQEVVLALDPTISFEEVINIQNKMSHVNLQLTPLTDNWRDTLRNRFEGR